MVAADADESGTAAHASPATESTGENPATSDPAGPTREEPGSTTTASRDLGVAAPPERPPPAFSDVTEEAGLALAPGTVRVAPFCLLDDVEKPQANDFCIPERFLVSAAAGDYDNDGWVDLYLTSLDAPDRLLRNRGNATFEDVTAGAGIADDHLTGAAVWADVDGDGDLDLLRTGYAAPRNFLHINDGAGGFTEEAVARGFAVQSPDPHVGAGIGVGDYDLDGWIDVFVADWHPDDPLGPADDHNRLLHNLGDGHFEDVTEAMGIGLRWLAPIVDAKPGAYGFAPAFVDIDGDDWPELTLTADFGTTRLWWNDGGLAFSDRTFESGLGTERNGMGSTFGDYDGDGDLDWFISAIETAEFPQLGNRMYRYDGGRQFADVTDMLGLRDGGWGWGAAFVDLEHDGDLDLALAAGWPTVEFAVDAARVWRNDDAVPWTECASELGIDFARQGRGLLPFDYDLDGDLDLFFTSNSERPALYRNDDASGHWLVVQVVGSGPNTQGLGATVRIQAQSDGPWQVRHIGVANHLYGQEEAVAHFGLGDNAVVHRVEVRWPATGEARVLDDVEADRRLTVFE